MPTTLGGRQGSVGVVSLCRMQTLCATNPALHASRRGSEKHEYRERVSNV